MDDKNQQILICGAGPAGLTAALLFLSRGWQDIVIVEQRQANQFERGKAFNYQFDGRGQRILDHLGMGPKVYETFGQPNDSFKLVSFAPDGTSKTIVPPILIPDRKTPYWMVRSQLLNMLHSEIEKRDTEGKIKLLYGHKFEQLEEDETGDLKVTVRDSLNKAHYFKPQLLLGCDGLHSKVRKALARLNDDQQHLFQMQQHPSPSAQLKYKVIQLPPKFNVIGSSTAVEHHHVAYAFKSTTTKRNQKMALFALPVAQGAPRNINIILHEDHEFWNLSSSAEIKSHLAEVFPQVPLSELISESEIEEFATASPGQFPEPQYSNKITARVNKGHNTIHCVLIGDSAHAFPPDLGLGVNSALEDLYHLNTHLANSNGDLSSACLNYEKQRLPENAALIRMVQKTHPYQYNQVPWRLKAWMMKFIIQLGLNRLSRGLIDEPGFMLSQRHTMDFVEMEQRRTRSEIAYYVTVTALASVLLWGLFNLG